MSGALRITLLALDAWGWVALATAGMGGVLIVMLRPILRRLHPGAATTRYAVCYLCLVLLALGPPALVGVIQWAYGDHTARVDELARDLVRGQSAGSETPPPGGWTRATLADALEREHALIQPLWLSRRPGLWLGTAMALLGLAWIVASLWSLGRLAREWRTIRALRNRGSPADARWRRAVSDASHRLGIRRPIVVRLTDAVDSPVLIGWRRPTILIPTRVHQFLGDREVRAIVAHEAAHVRHADFLANLLQSALEAVMALQPAVRWLSARVRDEREYAADEVARGSIDGSVVDYAGALTALEALRIRPPQPGVLAVNGGSLLDRIHRLAERGSHARRRAGIVDIALLLALIVGLAVSAMHLRDIGRGAAHAIMAHDLGLPRSTRPIPAGRLLTPPARPDATVGSAP